MHKTQEIWTREDRAPKSMEVQTQHLRQSNEALGYSKTFTLLGQNNLKVKSMKVRKGGGPPYL